MKILLTGAFGNVGSSTLQELIRQGHEVCCFDLKTPKNEAQAQKLQGKAQVIWGDVRQPADVAAAVQGQEVIIHLAFIIPPLADAEPELAEAVNMGGTRNMLAAAQSQVPTPKFFFASSFDVFGKTQDQEPPRRVDDPLQPTNDYTRHKIEGEELVRNSGLTWAIYRFCDVPPQEPRRPEPIMFTIPLNNRFEMVHPHDVALAIANGMQRPIWGKIWLIGGGPTCQIRYRDYLETVLVRTGIGKLPEKAFSTEPYCTDWVDSSESQALLQYQRHTFEDIMNETIAVSDPGPIVHLLMPIIRPFVRHSILKWSPYLKA